MISIRKGRGFTFVEVLVALVIIAVGVAGLVSLQRMFLQSSTRASERTAAMEMAQDKIEELRFTRFSNLAAGTDTEQRADKTFNLSWDVVSQYLVGSGWVPAGSPSEPDPLPPEPDAKAVTITVAWTERGGGSETLAMEAWFNNIESRDGGLVVTQPGARAQPKVTYNPGAAPEVIALRLTDDANADAYQVKETTKPTPQVQKQGDKLQVTFNTVTYNEVSKTQRIEDFVTVNCSCRFDGPGTSGKTPARLILEGDRLVLDPYGSQPTQKMVGVSADTNQSELCSLCCRDHHDNYDMVESGNTYRSTELRTDTGNHHHFKNVNGALVTAGQGDVYEESCRMRRVDGYYVTYPDWDLKAVSIMSSEYLLNAATGASYRNYVRDVVHALVTGATIPAQPAGRDDEFIPGAYQLIGRGVYLDRMSTSHMAAVQAAIDSGRADWLSMVPFYEVNLTLLGNWSSQNTNVATVTNEEIQTIVDPENNYYGTYSRGRLQALNSGTTTIDFQVSAGNASILGNGAVHTDELGIEYTSDMDVTVVGQADDDVALYSVTGNINCLFWKQTGKTGSWEACKSSDFRDVTVTTSDLNVTCQIETIGNTNTVGYSCPGIRAGTSLTVYFASANPSTTFTPASVSVSSISENVVAHTEMRIN
ncbi:type IV pilus modification PilV family protein [Pseudidiomarina insulisalsae]|uniref:Uncharacterized protein n=1 Tax=Pseudidiomarina insulisalsae TaxID=575789 RepID=A0A432YLM6_9GAMM|nr:prepilin-type N-terminal cleavage/methylation domain-containing protein [Pseudidiomarina insulisalsae]RUO61842.1 hypothetical protein CWI71_05645 [Pseudidiomarina insulisalsae]